ncbi:unnamed protein product, partial [Allacma fusca]
GTRYDEKLTG